MLKISLHLSKVLAIILYQYNNLILAEPPSNSFKPSFMKFKTKSQKQEESKTENIPVQDEPVAHREDAALQSSGSRSLNEVSSAKSLGPSFMRFKTKTQKLDEPKTESILVPDEVVAQKEARTPQSSGYHNSNEISNQDTPIEYQRDSEDAKNYSATLPVQNNIDYGDPDIIRRQFNEERNQFMDQIIEIILKQNQLLTQKSKLRLFI